MANHDLCHGGSGGSGLPSEASELFKKLALLSLGARGRLTARVLQQV